MPLPGMPMPQGAGSPPPISGGAANVGPAVQPQGNQGNIAMAMTDIKNGLQMFQKALPMIPMGSPLHGDILDVTKKISKHLEESGGGGNQGLEINSLLQMAKQASQQAPISALARLYPGAGAPPAMPGAGGGQPAPAAAA